MFKKPKPEDFLRILIENLGLDDIYRSRTAAINAWTNSGGSDKDECINGQKICLNEKKQNISAFFISEAERLKHDPKAQEKRLETAIERYNTANMTAEERQKQIESQDDFLWEDQTWSPSATAEYIQQQKVQWAYEVVFRQHAWQEIEVSQQDNAWIQAQREALEALQPFYPGSLYLEEQIERLDNLKSENDPIDIVYQALDPFNPGYEMDERFDPEGIAQTQDTLPLDSANAQGEGEDSTPVAEGYIDIKISQLAAYQEAYPTPEGEGSYVENEINRLVKMQDTDYEKAFAGNPENENEEEEIEADIQDDGTIEEVEPDDEPKSGLPTDANLSSGITSPYLPSY